jgi:D-galactarolactone cycloisomerase
LKIEKVETFPLLHKLPQPYGDANGFKKYRSCFLLRIITDSGIDGWGECVDWLPTLEKGFHERIIPYLIGKRAENRLPLVKVIKKWHQRAAAGVSMALTEIIAKKAGLSICDLWGGRWQDTIPVYASFQSYSEDLDWEGHSIRLVERAVGDGFTRVKVKIGGKTIEEDQRHIAGLQSKLQESVSIVLDANQSYDAAAAREWEPYFSKWNNFLWLEEPMPMDRVAEYKFLRSALSIPLAGGENIKSAKDFLPLIKDNAIDILQPDPMHQDGIDGYRESLQLARLSGLRVSSHVFDGGLSRLYALLAHACLPPWSKMEGETAEPVEWDVMENPFTRLLPIEPSGGQVCLPDGIGLGVELDWDIIRKYRWDGAAYVE